MPVIDSALTSLIKYLQEKQKSHRKKINKIKKKEVKEKVIKKKKKVPKKILKEDRNPLLRGKALAQNFKKRSKNPKKKILKKTKKKILAKRTKSIKQKKAILKKVKKIPKVKKSGKVKSKLIKKEKKPTEISGIQIGEITHYFNKIQVIVVKITKGKIKVGDKIHIKGRNTDFIQKIKSLQIESIDVGVARKGQLVGLKADKPAREGDIVHILR